MALSIGVIQQLLAQGAITSAQADQLSSKAPDAPSTATTSQLAQVQPPAMPEPPSNPSLDQAPMDYTSMDYDDDGNVLPGLTPTNIGVVGAAAPTPTPTDLGVIGSRPPDSGIASPQTPAMTPAGFLASNLGNYEPGHIGEMTASNPYFFNAKGSPIPLAQNTPSPAMPPAPQSANPGD